MREINWLRPTISLDSKHIGNDNILSHQHDPCSVLYSGVWRKVYRTLWNCSLHLPHSCGETTVKVIMGRVPHSSFLLCVWVLYVGEAQNDYFCTWFFCIIPWSNRLLVYYLLMSKYAERCLFGRYVVQTLLIDSKCWVCYSKVLHS